MHEGFYFLAGAWTRAPVAQFSVQIATDRDLLGSPLWRLRGLPHSIAFTIGLGSLGPIDIRLTWAHVVPPSAEQG